LITSAAIRGAPVLKSFRLGTHRQFHPEETVQRALRVAPVIGITRVANVTGLDSIGLPVTMVTRPNARSLAVSQGKGVTVTAAKASGLMESIEAYHAETITLPLRHCTYEELRYAHAVVDVTELPFVESSIFDPNLKVLWCEGVDILNDEPMFVPYELVHTDYTWPHPAGTGSFVNSSNGLASGNHILEAVSQGICEVIERDSVTLWHLRGPAEQDFLRVDVSTVDDPACRDVLEKFDRAGLGVLIWDATTDIGIASFVCVIFPREDDPLRPIAPAMGAGCHPSRAVALLRALTEAAQSRLTQIAGSRDDVPRTLYQPSPETLTMLRGQLETSLVRSFHEVPDRNHDSLGEDVDWELERLSTVGIERVVVVDLTKEAFNIPVVRVVIPGLEGVHEVPGYVPGKRVRALLAAS
jgi:ribosomal protein S12 methylthiotransferase accessory factor